MDWIAMATPWLKAEGAVEATHAPVLQALMDQAELRPGHKALDIGPGSGLSLVHAAAAVGAAGHVTGVEIAPPFAERARQRVPANVSVVLGDAQEIDLPSDSADVAISLFGMMFFRDSIAAFANLRRIVVPGGRMTFACWGPPSANPYFAMPARVAAEVFGPGPAFDPAAPGPMRFANAPDVLKMLAAAGWSAEVETLEIRLTPVGSPDEVAETHMTIGSAANRMRLEKEAGRLTDTGREAVRAGLRKAYADMVEEGAVRIPAQIHFFSAKA